MKPLVATPSPYPTESLWGFLLRLSEANGYDRPGRILAYMEVSESQRKTSSIPLEKLATLLAQSAFTQPQISFHLRSEEDKSFRLLGHSLGTLSANSPLRLHNPAFCPDCVREDGYMDAFWHVSLAVACPKHNREAIDRCSCGRTLTWSRPGLLVCKCEQNLSELPVADVPDVVTDIMAVLWNKVHRTPFSTIDNRSGFPLQHLDGVSLLNLLRLMRLLGGHNLRSKDINEKEDDIKLVAAAAEVLKDWPAAFHGMLCRIEAQEKEQNPGARTFRQCHDRFFQSVYHPDFQSSENEFLREELMRYGSQIWKGIYRRRLDKGSHQRGRYVLISELARDWKSSQRAALKRSRDEVYTEKITAVVDQPRYFIKVENLGLGKRWEGITLSQRAAAKYIGLPFPTLCALLNTEYYVRDALSAKRKDLYKSDLDRLRQKFLSCAEPVDFSSLNAETIISLDYVLFKLQFRSDGKLEFVIGYLNGTLKPVGRCGNTIADIYFDREDVRHFAGECRAATKL